MRDSSMQQDAAEPSSSSMATSSTASDAFSPKPGQHGARSAAGDHANADACPDKETGGVRRPRMHGSRAGVSSESRVSSGRPASFFHIPPSRPHSDIDAAAAAMDPSFPPDGAWAAQDRPRTIHFPSSQVDFSWTQQQTHGAPPAQPIFPHGYAPPEMLPPQHFTAVADPAPLPPPGAALYVEPPLASGVWHTVGDAITWAPEAQIPTAREDVFDSDPFGFEMKRNSGQPLYPPNSEYAAPAPWVLYEQRTARANDQLFVQFSGNVDASPLFTAKLPLQEAQEQGLVAPVVDSGPSAPPPPPVPTDERTTRRPTRLGRLFSVIKPAAAESRSQADGKRRRIFGKLRAGFGSRSDDRRNQSQSQNENQTQKQTQDENEGVADPPRVVAPEEWRAYGQWARPCLDRVQVENRPFRPQPPPPHPVDMDAVVRSLKGPNGSPHPENWIPGLPHPAIPARPAAFGPFDSSLPPLPAHQTTLNAFLEHRPWGHPPLIWDMRERPSCIFYATTAMNARGQGPVPAGPTDLAQAATHPLRASLRIAHVADDSAPAWPWPVTVTNPQGVACADVYVALAANFAEHVRAHEYAALTEERQLRVRMAWQARIAMPPYRRDSGGFADSAGDAVRRIDYLGERVMFRGIEPSPERDGSWVLFVGPP